MELNWIYLIALIFTGACSTEEVVETENGIEIYNMKIENGLHGQKLQKYLNNSRILFYNCQISIFSIYMIQQMKALTKLQFRSGKINTLYIAPQLEEIRVRGTLTENIFIEAANEYKLSVFMIVDIPTITVLPKNLNKLKELARLYINNCGISYINTDDLNGLDKLTTFTINNNQISTIKSPLNIPLNLPSLQILGLLRNSLSKINFSEWNLPSLRMLVLDYNRLSTIESLSTVSSSLDSLMLHGNPLNCQWLAAVRTVISKVFISSSKQEECENLFSWRAYEEEIFQLELNKSSHGHQLKMRELEGKIGLTDELNRKQEQELSDLKIKMDQCFAKIGHLEHQNDDLIAALYENTIEHAEKWSSISKEDHH